MIWTFQQWQSIGDFPMMPRSFMWRTLWCFLAVASASSLLHAAPPYPIPPDTVIVLQSGPCELDCPVYRVVVFGDGDVIWQGIDKVHKKGLAFGQITRDQVRELLGAFKAAGYMELQNDYGYHGKGCASTEPSMKATAIFTSITVDGVSRAIKHDQRCVGEVTDRLTAIEKTFNEVTGTARWIK